MTSFYPPQLFVQIDLTAHPLDLELDTDTRSFTMAAPTAMIDPAIFESLQAKIDDDSAFRDKIRDTVQLLEKQVKSAQALLSRVHSTPAANLPPVLQLVEKSITEESATITSLSQLASTQPYYKWNQMWNRTVQDCVWRIHRSRDRGCDSC